MTRQKVVLGGHVTCGTGCQILPLELETIIYYLLPYVLFFFSSIGWPSLPGIHGIDLLVPGMRPTPVQVSAHDYHIYVFGLSKICPFSI